MAAPIHDTSQSGDPWQPCDDALVAFVACTLSRTPGEPWAQVTREPKNFHALLALSPIVLPEQMAVHIPPQELTPSNVSARRGRTLSAIRVRWDSFTEGNPWTSGESSWLNQEGFDGLSGEAEALRTSAEIGQAYPYPQFREV